MLHNKNNMEGQTDFLIWYDKKNQNPIIRHKYHLVYIHCD